jgi:gamma-glutamyltranspeptidase/glutathione hydrolase
LSDMSEEFTTRPLLMGTHGMVTSTHYLATEAGLQILRRGGNVVDAGAAIWFCQTVLEPHLAGPAGEASILLYWADDDEVLAVNGQGPAPRAATIEWFRGEGYELIPGDGFLPAVVPGAFDAWLLLLMDFGTLSLEEVLKPALEMAGGGFPVYPGLSRAIQRCEERFRAEWPTSAEVYLPDGGPPEVGSILRNPPLAQTLRRLIEVERSERMRGRISGLEAVRDYFYRGPIAEAIVEFMRSFKCRDSTGREHHGLIALEDFERFSARIERPVSTSYRGYTVHKCGPWSQGPVFLQQLNILEGFDLKAMGHNSADYLHTLIEAAKLAYADRERYYADPEYVEVPLETLLSKDYAEKRRRLIDPERASLELRPGEASTSTHEGGRMEMGTVHLDVVDGFGNMISATPSGGWITSSPLIPGLGFPMGTRGQMFHLDPGHVERLEPGKRPSTTLSPSLVTKDGLLYMAFGTPGGDQQDQWTLQLFLNHADFGMNIQRAIDMPTVHTTHFPASFWPHDAHPGVVHVEPGIPEDSIEGLRKRGHTIVLDPPWSHGRCLAVAIDRDTGLMMGGASPRAGTPYAMGW